MRIRTKALLVVAVLSMSVGCKGGGPRHPGSELESGQAESGRSSATDGESSMGELMPPSLWLDEQSTPSDASLRGLCAVDRNTAWASGSRGTVLRTVDGGGQWQSVSVEGAETLDFRDVHAFDGSRAVVFSAGAPAKIFRTVDGGASWLEVYSNNETGIFFDAMDFWDEKRGIAFGDPIDGRFRMIATDDGGVTWHDLQGPLAEQDEAGFAASGSCLTVGGVSNVWFVTGGGAARVLRSEDGGQTWREAGTALGQGKSSAGCFSVAFHGTTHGIVVGGDYSEVEAGEVRVARSEDGGASWQPLPEASPSYRSAVAYVPTSGGRLVVSTGTPGTDYSIDSGLSWQPLSEVGYHTVSFAEDGAGWVAGGDGRVARIQIASE